MRPHRLAGRHRGKYPSWWHRNHHAAEAWEQGEADAQVDKFHSGHHCFACIVAYNEGWSAGKEMRG